MSAAFGWTVEYTEREVVALIQRGEILGRVDSQNKILRARSTNHRAQLYAHALKAGTDMQSATKKLLLRLQLCARLVALIAALILTFASIFFFLFTVSKLTWLFAKHSHRLHQRRERGSPSWLSSSVSVTFFAPHDSCTFFFTHSSTNRYKSC
jgi:hypothetical protein